MPSSSCPQALKNGPLVFSKKYGGHQKKDVVCYSLGNRKVSSKKRLTFYVFSLIR